MTPFVSRRILFVYNMLEYVPSDWIRKYDTYISWNWFPHSFCVGVVCFPGLSYMLVAVAMRVFSKSHSIRIFFLCAWVSMFWNVQITFSTWYTTKSWARIHLDFELCTCPVWFKKMANACKVREGYSGVLGTSGWDFVNQPIHLTFSRYKYISSDHHLFYWCSNLGIWHEFKVSCNSIV